MSFEDACHIGLGLGLGSCHGRFHENRVVKSDRHQQRQKPTLKLDNMFSSSSMMNTQQEAIRNLNEPSLTLGLSSEETSYGAAAVKKIDVNMAYEESINDAVVLRQQASSPHATVMSSFSNASVKRERDMGCSEDMEVEKVSSRISDEDEEASGRKKLRLTKEQSALLEESFKEHSTLNPKQKQALAKQLNLRARQVEVWFQNRRARTKLKQTEVDCEFLKKCCETLTDENRRLQKELQELKALKLAQPLYMQLPAATLTMCPSCERIGNGSNSVGDNSSKNTFTIAAKPHFFNPFTHSSSAAC